MPHASAVVPVVVRQRVGGAPVEEELALLQRVPGLRARRERADQRRGLLRREAAGDEAKG